MSITITDEQLAEAHAWEVRLFRKQCTLNEALFMIMQSGAPVPPMVQQAFVLAEMKYHSGEVKEMAESFGHVITQRYRQKMKSRELQSMVRVVVDRYAEQGFPRTYTAKSKDTAFHKAAEELHKAASTLYGIYYDND